MNKLNKKTKMKVIPHKMILSGIVMKIVWKYKNK